VRALVRFSRYISRSASASSASSGRSSVGSHRRTPRL